MALDTMALSTARGKLESAKSESDWMIAQGSLREALTDANQALVAARRANDSLNKLEALEIVAQCNMYLGDMFAANLAVTDELAMIRRTQDKKAEIKCLQLAAEVHMARGDGNGAVEALQDATKLLESNPDKAAEAKTMTLLGMAKLALSKAGEALAPAQDAMKLYQELGDESGQKDARRTLNLVYAARNQLDKAPDRAEALQALKDLASSVDTRNSVAWTGAMETLDRIGAYSQKDIDQVANDALEKDRYNSTVFLEEQGVVVKAGAGGKASIVLSEYSKTMHYIMFRVGGLGYGPRFRCGRCYRKVVPGAEDKVCALACLQTAEEADDWERDLQFHPGILDSMLQSCGVASTAW